jgi:hypothetical protein
LFDGVSMCFRLSPCLPLSLLLEATHGLGPRGCVPERPGWRTMLRGTSWDHRWSWRPSTWSLRSGWTATCLGRMLGRDEFWWWIPVNTMEHDGKWGKIKVNPKNVVFSPWVGFQEHGLTNPKWWLKHPSIGSKH